MLFLSQQKHSFDKLNRIRDNIRNGLLSTDKFQEISERPNYMQQREEYESQYRQLPPNPCCFKFLHCGRDHPIRMHYDYEIPSYNRQNVISRFLENVLIAYNPSSIKSLKSHLTFYSIPKSRSCRNSYNNPNNNNNNNIPTSPVSSERDAIAFRYYSRKKSGASSNLGNRNSSNSNYSNFPNTVAGNNNASSSMVNKYLQSQAQIQMQQQMQQQYHHHSHHHNNYIGTPKGLANSSLKKSINSQKNSMNVTLDMNAINNNTRSKIKRNSVGAMYSNASIANGTNNGLTSPFIKSQRVIHSCKNSVNSNKDNNPLANSPFDYKKSEFSPNDVNNISLYNRQMMNAAVSRKNKISPLMPPRPPPALPDFS